MWVLIQNIILSILIIYLAHSLWNYILQTCTVQKKKDLVKFQQDKYASIFHDLLTKPDPESESIMMTSDELDQYVLDAMTDTASSALHQE